MNRIIAIDISRFIALLGMIAAHLLDAALEFPWLTTVTMGFPSTLFAVLGGFGVVFSSRRYLRDGRRLAALVAGITRGAMVVLVGLLMELLPPHPIAVILVYYGFAIMVASVLVLLPQWPLVSLLGLLMVAVPLAGSTVAPLSDFGYGSLDFSSPTAFVTTAWLTGTYPALTWTIYLGWGIVMARALVLSARPSAAALKFGSVGLGAWVTAELVSGWRIRHVAGEMAASGMGSKAEMIEYLRGSMYGVPYAPGWDALLVASPHSGSTTDIMRTAGAAFVLISALFIAFGRVQKRPLLLLPIIKTGATPLTAYTLHIVMTSFALTFLVQEGDYWSTVVPFLASTFWWQSAVLLLMGLVLTLLNRRGPLEFLVSWVSQAAGNAVEKGSRLAAGK